MKFAVVLIALRPWLGLIEHEAERAGVSPVTLGAIVFTESRGQPHLVSKEKNGSCSVGLGMVNVPDCNPMRISSLQDPAYNVQVAAKILRANERWCRSHRADRYCRAGERVFPRGGGVNRYAGRSSTYAKTIAPARRVVRALLSARHARQKKKGACSPGR